MDIDRDKLKTTLDNIRAGLLEFRCKEGYWAGRLSSSALSTATAVFALSTVDGDKYRYIIKRGLDWLCDNCNPDGAWGDTTLSKSNISTTLLCLAALTVDKNSDHCKVSTQKAKSWIENKVGSLAPAMIIKAVDLQYGRDKTFAAPILTMCALSGILDHDKNVWDSITPLPFELAACPHWLFKWLHLRVVSYALPALIAIGRVHFHNKSPSNPLRRFIRKLTTNRTLRILSNIQPESGGFLEAVPLTSFVTMSLLSIGERDNQVVTKGARFLVNSVREDGSWPIDTDLATWLTTLSVNALTAGCAADKIFSKPEQIKIRDWLLTQQYQSEHPYTHAAPGGWAWTDLPGAVPDADDTAGALIALNKLGFVDEHVIDSATKGVIWLLGLQNRDGGIPTFCRGWGKLEFDRSAPDLTAHAITALKLWLPSLDKRLIWPVDRAIQKATEYLRQSQHPNGSWLPLWFGNENTRNHTNPVYGTARVLTGLSSISDFSPNRPLPMVLKGVNYLLDAQNQDGGWGGDRLIKSTIEETSVALSALIDSFQNFTWAGITSAEQTRQNIKSSIQRGANWILENYKDGRDIQPAPIGLYFAKLWYYEKLYPLIFASAALTKLNKLLG